MTSTVVVRKNGIVCIAADTLARYGSIREDAALIKNCDKLVRVDDAILCPTGPASAQLIMNSYFQNPDRKRDFGSMQGIFETFREFHAAMKDDYFLNPKEDESDPFDSSQMEVLVASPHGIFGIYTLRSVQEYHCYYAFGSGGDLALGAMHAIYDEESNPEVIARRGLEAAARFDTSTQAPFTFETIPLASGV